MYVLVDKNLRSEERETLQKLGFYVLSTTAVSGIENSLSTHPDIQVHFVDSCTVICEPTTFSYYQSIMPEHISLIPGKSLCTSTYPKDCAYNVTRIGRHVFANTACADTIIMTYYQEKKYQIHHVRQGYVKCNTCIITEQYVLTEDEGLHNIFMANKVHSKLIKSGEIELAGYPYGFIGGASGNDDECIYFFGNLEGHPLYEEIRAFIQSVGKNICSLSENKLRDNGSMFFFD